MSCASKPSSRRRFYDAQVGSAKDPTDDEIDRFLTLEMKFENAQLQSEDSGLEPAEWSKFESEADQGRLAAAWTETRSVSKASSTRSQCATHCGPWLTAVPTAIPRHCP